VEWWSCSSTSRPSGDPGCDPIPHNTFCSPHPGMRMVRHEECIVMVRKTEMVEGYTGLIIIGTQSHPTNRPRICWFFTRHCDKTTKWHIVDFLGQLFLFIVRCWVSGCVLSCSLHFQSWPKQKRCVFIPVYLPVGVDWCLNITICQLFSWLKYIIIIMCNRNKEEFHCLKWVNVVFDLRKNNLQPHGS